MTYYWRISYNYELEWLSAFCMCFVFILFYLMQVVSVHDVLHASVGLCQRNTQRLDPEESDSLWFRLLDS